MKKGQKKAASAPEARPDEQKEMNDVTMADLLIEFQGSVYWNAYKRYIDSRLDFIDQSLRSIDPFKNPTDMARGQGNRHALLDVEDYINRIKHSRLNKEVGEDEVNPTGNA